MFPSIGNVVTPLSPRLTDESRTQLLGELSRHGLPEVAQNSVVITLLSALGTEPKDGAVRYDEPYPQLPKIDAQGTRRSDRCAEVSLQVSHAASNPPLAIGIDGRWCLLDPKLWVWQHEVLRVTTLRVTTR